MTLFCGPDAGRKALCFLDVKPEAAADVAERLGGQTYGFSSVTAGIQLTERFDCDARRDGAVVDFRCTCRLAW